MEVVVRFVDDTRTNKCWFEEKLKNGQWVEISCTRMACEGNSRHQLQQELERRRQQNLAIVRNYGDEEIYQV